MDRLQIYRKLVFSFFCLLFYKQEVNAQMDYSDVMLNIGDANYGIFDGEASYDEEKALNHIRRERFYLILPSVMREAKVDMWIHVIRPWSWGGTDPLRYEFGSKSGVFIFTDRGDENIEKAVFQGEVQDPSAYDIIGERYKYLSQQDYEFMDWSEENPGESYKSELDFRFEGIGEFIAERNPKRIAVNYMETLSFSEGSETFTMALTDGISYTDYIQLSKSLGDKYAKRMVSAEHLILDYLSRRVAAEVVLYGSLRAQGGKTRTFDNIVPGVTTLGDIGGASVINKDGNEKNSDNYLIQRGDLILSWQGNAYVLRKGEKDLPWYVRKFWDDDKKIRDILRRNIKVGLTGGETLKLIASELEDAGFVYTDYQEYNKYINHPKKTQVHIDMHAEGKGILAPRISPMGPKWHWDVKIRLFHTFAVEYMTYMYIPEWGRANNFKGQHLSGFFHDGGVVTGRGMEIPYPDRSNKIQIIQ